MMRFATTAALALAAALGALAQGVQINSSVKNGDTLSGVVEIRVTVFATGTVTQVEFYVNDDLRTTDTSTPYTYTLDTIPEKEGPMTIEIAAYTTEGESKKLRLNVKVDNEVGKGADFHVENAKRFLNVAKYDEAIQAARVALKADEDSVPAKLAMSRAYMGKGVLDKAQQWAEDAVITKETVEGTELLAGIHVDRAFRIISMSGDKGDALKEITAALKAAVAQKQASSRLRLSELGPVTDANRLRVVDLFIGDHDYSAARRMLLEKWDENKPDTAVGNRLVYATMRSGRMEEAYKIADAIQKRGAPNATTWALMAAGHGYYRQWDNANAAIRNGGFDDQDAPQLMTASAYLAALRGDSPAMSSQISRMLNLNLTAPETFYYLYVMQFYVGQYVESRENFRKTVLLDPLLYDAYVERGYQALISANFAQPGLDRDKQLILDQAQAFFEIALAVKQDAAEALNGLAIAQLYRGEVENGVRMAKAAAGAGPEYPWAHFTLSAALYMQRQTQEAQKAVDLAGKLDKVVLEGRTIPTLNEAWDYTRRFGRLPVVVPPK